MLASCIAQLAVPLLTKVLDVDQLTVLTFAFALTVSVAFQPGLIKISVQMTAGKECSWTDVFVELPKTPIYMIATALYFCAIAIAGAFLVIPGLIVSALFSFYGFAIVKENANPIYAFRRSVTIAKSYWPSIIVAQVFMVLIMLIPMLLTGEIAYTLAGTMPITILPYLIFLAIIYNYECDTRSPKSHRII